VIYERVNVVMETDLRDGEFLGFATGSHLSEHTTLSQKLPRIVHDAASGHYGGGRILDRERDEVPSSPTIGQGLDSVEQLTAAAATLSGEAEAAELMRALPKATV
jgi:hypothetical protein